MKHMVTLGVVALARKTFDYEAAADLYARIRKDLEELPQVKAVCIPELLIEVEDAVSASERLRAEGVDALVCISATFHLGHLVLELEKRLHIPIFLWGLPELPCNGDKIRLNSVCGVNLNASNLYKSGVRNYYAHIGLKIDEDWVDAVRILRTFRDAHVGIAGFRAHGFFNLGVYDLDLYRQLGVLLDHYELQEIWTTDVSAEDIAKRKKELHALFDVSGISEEQLDLVADLSAKLTVFLEKNRLDALAIRCWPEHAAEFGISPCAAMSLLQAEDRIISCEGDVEGALSMLAHKAVGGETPFLIDFSGVDLDNDYALFWQCGAAPCNLWDGKCVRSLDASLAGGKGVTADFVIKSGEISILRFDSAGTEYRIFLQKGEAIPMDKDLKGTYAKVVFREPVRTVLDKVIQNGIAHHASMVYGDFIRPFEIFARISGWKVIK